MSGTLSEDQRGRPGVTLHIPAWAIATIVAVCLSIVAASAKLIWTASAYAANYEHLSGKVGQAVDDLSRIRHDLNTILVNQSGLSATLNEHGARLGALENGRREKQ